MRRRMRSGPLIAVDVARLGAPDTRAIDTLARTTLLAGRLGSRLRFVHASAELCRLVALAGLADVVDCETGSGVEPRR